MSEDATYTVHITSPTTKATVAASPVDNTAKVTTTNDGKDEATDNVVVVARVIAASISIVKTAGNAADGAELRLANPANATFTYVVKNTGPTDLQNVKLVDDNATLGDTKDEVTVTCPATTLAAGASMTCTAIMPARSVSGPTSPRSLQSLSSIPRRRSAPRTTRSSVSWSRRSPRPRWSSRPRPRRSSRPRPRRSSRPRPRPDPDADAEWRRRSGDGHPRADPSPHRRRVGQLGYDRQRPLPHPLRDHRPRGGAGGPDPQPGAGPTAGPPRVARGGSACRPPGDRPGRAAGPPERTMGSPRPGRDVPSLRHVPSALRRTKCRVSDTACAIHHAEHGGGGGTRVLGPAVTGRTETAAGRVVEWG